MDLTRHTVREIAVGRPLDAGQPVPGCTCLMCAVFRLGGSMDDVAGAERTVGELKRHPHERREVEAQSILADTPWKLPPSDVLVRYAAAVRHLPAVAIELEPEIPTQRKPEQEPLPVEEARQVEILDVAERLGIKLRRVGKSWRGACPIHNGDGPNFSIVPALNGFRCWTCGETGDSISLWMSVRGVDFPAAVRELTHR